MRRLDPSSYNMFLLVVVLIVGFGFFLVWRLRRDVEQDSGEVTDEELLKSFEQAYFEGEMEEAEFRRVTDRLKAKMAGIPSASPQAEGNKPADLGGVEGPNDPGEN